MLDQGFEAEMKEIISLIPKGNLLCFQSCFLIIAPLQYSLVPLLLDILPTSDFIYDTIDMMI